MKRCSVCNLEKEVGEFFYQSRAKDQLHSQCKLCYKEHRKSYAADHYRKYGDAYRARAKARRSLIKKQLQSELLAYLEDKSCELCSENDIRVLEFDHKDRSTKSFGISKGITDGKRWSEILEEIEKCRILCANCHKKHTASQFDWYKKTPAI